MADDVWSWTDGSGLALVDLSDRTKYLVLPPDDTGVSDIETVERATPLGHGASFVFSRLKSRKFVINVIIRAGDWATQQNLRDAWIAAFSPAKGQGKLRVVRANGTTREIVCAVAVGPKFHSAGRKGMNRMEPITFQCSDPLWYDPVPAVASLAAAGSPGAGTVTVVNNGDWESFPVIVISAAAHAITGPLMITNSTTGKLLRYMGSIPLGDTVTFDTTYFQPQVFSSHLGVPTNQFTLLDPASSMWSLPHGANTLLYTDSGTGANTHTITFKHRYSGV